MAEKFREGDSVALQGEITHVHDTGTVTVRVHGLDYPLTMRAEHLSLVAKARTPKRGKPLYDEHQVRWNNWNMSVKYFTAKASILGESFGF